MRCFKAEIYKIFFNLSFYFCYFCVFITSIIGVIAIEPQNRITRESGLFSYIFLFICNLIIGSIISNEYSGTLKDRIIAVGNRKQIFVSKVILCLLSITCIYMFHVFLFVITNKGVQINIFINQYKAVMQHTFLLIGIAVVLKSFSSLSMATVIMLCIYKELSNLIMPVSVNIIFNNSYFVQFMSTDKLVFTDCLFCFGAMLSVIIGYFIFCYQDIK